MSNATGTLPTFLNDPRLLPKRDELSRTALHCLVISTACAREVRGQRDNFFYMPIRFVPKLDAKGSSSSPPDISQYVNETRTRQGTKRVARRLSAWHRN